VSATRFPPRCRYLPVLLAELVFITTQMAKASLAVLFVFLRYPTLKRSRLYCAGFLCPLPLSSAMSTFEPTKRGSDRGSDDSVKQPQLEADHALTLEKSNVEAQADPAFARKTLRKIDVYVLPILAVLYSFSLIDRVNISWAYV
jgi:hypothetical protein